MAATITITVTETTNADVSTEAISQTISVANPVDDRRTYNIASGDNTITVPNGATVALVTPPSSNTYALKEKSVSGDAGEPRAANLPFVVTLSGQTSFVLNASGAVGNTVVHCW